jgi:hypothetical protein
MMTASIMKIATTNIAMTIIAEPDRELVRTVRKSRA